ncbi:MAG TPA: ribosomal protein S18-alanine N-acetyltransferase [Sphingomicrobium sp.]|nr:ribosomal protein S18-alanine N-acetyltransferase [Sphingomicrobium sp.]
MATPALRTEVLVERGSSRDIDAVMEVMEAAFGERFGEAWTRSQLAGILPMAGVTLMLARTEGSDAVIGFSLARTVADESELLLIAVVPGRHRRGIGQRLLEHFLERAQKDGLARVHLEVREGNPAVAMYERAGFSPAGRRRNYYHARGGERFDAITLVREL